ncbi:MAG: tyrosine-type recombinase/integrase [Cyanobium sp.]
MVQKAVSEAGVSKAASFHTFRHSFATYLLEHGQDTHTIQELLGHQGISTTMICTHVLNRGPLDVRSPADIMWRPEQVVFGPVSQSYPGACVAKMDGKAGFSSCFQPYLAVVHGTVQ